jgi:hypothetical protein
MLSISRNTGIVCAEENRHQPDIGLRGTWHELRQDVERQLGCVAAEASVQDVQAADVVISQSRRKAKASLLILGPLCDRVAEEDDLMVGLAFSPERTWPTLTLHGHVFFNSRADDFSECSAEANRIQLRTGFKARKKNFALMLPHFLRRTYEKEEGITNGIPQVNIYQVGARK